jgi:hypothetical protein
MPMVTILVQYQYRLALVFIIQMQDAECSTNSTNYGSGIVNSFFRSKGGTGFTNIGNTGVFEYVITTNNVPLTGGNLTFTPVLVVVLKIVSIMLNQQEEERTFQIIRLPQYSI